MSKLSIACQHFMHPLAGISGVRAKGMFGGYGIYHQDRMFGLVAFDVLHLKVDDESKHYFEQAGCKPFVYHPPNDRPTISMSYYEAPLSALDRADDLEPWAWLGINAAARAAAKKPKRAPRKKLTKAKAKQTAKQSLTKQVKKRKKAAKRPSKRVDQ